MEKEGTPKVYYGYIVVLVACLILIMTQGTYYSFGVFFKPLSQDFGWTRAMTSGAFSLCVVLHGLLYIVTGRLNDRIGPRFVITGCGLLIGIGYLLMSRIGTLWQLYVFYGVIVAIGMSGGYIPLVSTVSRWFVKRRGLMTGIVATGTGFGTLIVPPIANWLINTYDWRDSYVIMGIAVIALILPAAQFLRRDPGQVGQLSYTEKETKIEDIGWETKGFSLSEAVRAKQFWMLFATKFCFGFCLMVVMVHIVPHATDLGISAAKAATIIAIIGGTGIIGRVTMGAFSDRIGYKKGYVICFVLTLLTLASLLVVKETWAFYLFAAVFGITYGGMATVSSPLIADLFGLRSHGAIWGSTSTGSTVGGAISPIVAGRIFDLTGNYQIVFVICATMAAIGLILASSLKPTTAVRR